MSTLKTTVVRSETLFVSRDVMRGLRVLAMRSDDPLLDCADALGDALLRDILATNPKLAERERQIHAFFRQLNKQDQSQ